MGDGFVGLLEIGTLAVEVSLVLSDQFTLRPDIVLTCKGLPVEADPVLLQQLFDVLEAAEKRVDVDGVLGIELVILQLDSREMSEDPGI